LLSHNEIIIQGAAKYISSHINEEIALHTLADMYAMSDSYFSRLFKEYTGVGVSKYIKLTRLRKAEKLLVSGNYSITEIALKCGFNNSNYFISEFKKHKGTTPFKYASLNKENER
jgi:AraC-like DNA-binding protein